MTFVSRFDFRFGIALSLLTGLVLVATFAAAQDEPPAEPPPPPAQVYEAPAPQTGPDPGPFKAGRKRVGLFAGAGSTFNQTYFMIGVGGGYYVLDGLEVGLDVEGWLGKDPSIWKVTPQVRYVLWQLGALKPYVGAFYRANYYASPYPDFNSYGGRAGVAYRNGGNYVAVGVVHEIFEQDDFFGKSSATYPEVAFWISF
jgi:hypothetical protein